MLSQRTVHTVFIMRVDRVSNVHSGELVTRRHHHRFIVTSIVSVIMSEFEIDVAANSSYHQNVQSTFASGSHSGQFEWYFNATPKQS